MLRGGLEGRKETTKRRLVDLMLVWRPLLQQLQLVVAHKVFLPSFAIGFGFLGLIDQDLFAGLCCSTVQRCRGVDSSCARTQSGAYPKRDKRRTKGD